MITTLQGNDMAQNEFARVTPGEMLNEEFLSALRLSLYFGNSPEFWMNLQSHYELKVARQKLKPAEAKRIKARRAA